jgi:hypothetical protein
MNGLNDPFSSPLKEISSQLQYIPVNETIKYIDGIFSFLYFNILYVFVLICFSLL